MTPDRVFRLGTRRSALAMAQSQHVADALAAASGSRVELVPIVSEGDTNRASLSTLGGRGVFATRLREALLAGECDLLVHSLKDLPTAQPEGLVLGAIPPREDARDVVVTRDGRSLADLEAGARVGTGSPRRIAQVRRFHPRVEVIDIRGNVDSRVARVTTGDLDAVILAAAGLARLGTPLIGAGADFRGLAEWPTAPGQGALAVETTVDAADDLAAALALLDDLDTRIETSAERAVLAGLDAGCSAPVGAHADVVDGELRLRAIVYAPDGSRRVGLDAAESLGEGYIRAKSSGNDADAAEGDDPVARAEHVGSSVAERLLQRGAADLVP